MCWRPGEVQLPVGVPERMGQYHGRCAEPNHYSPQPRGHLIHPRWSSHRCCSYSRGLWPCSGWRLPWCGKRGMCHHRVGVGWDACDWLGQNTERGPSAEHCVELAGSPKETDLKTLLAEHASSKEGKLVWRNCQNFTIHQKALYLCSMSKGKNENLLLFEVPRAHRVATLNGCHWDAGHQGCDHTLSLLQEHFWWPGMTSQMWQSIRTCNTVYNTRVACPRPHYTPSWLLLPWISYMLISPA